MIHCTLFRFMHGRTKYPGPCTELAHPALALVTVHLHLQLLSAGDC